MIKIAKNTWNIRFSLHIHIKFSQNLCYLCSADIFRLQKELHMPKTMVNNIWKACIAILMRQNMNYEPLNVHLLWLTNGIPFRWPLRLRTISTLSRRSLSRRASFALVVLICVTGTLLCSALPEQAWVQLTTYFSADSTHHTLYSSATCLSPNSPLLCWAPWRSVAARTRSWARSWCRCS